MLPTSHIVASLVHVFDVLEVILRRFLLPGISLNASLQLLELRLLLVRLLRHVELLNFIGVCRNFDLFLLCELLVVHLFRITVR